MKKIKNPFINNKWLEKHLKEIKTKAGPRYTPELNVELPISEVFEVLSRTSKFYDEVRKHYGNLIRETRHFFGKDEVKDMQGLYNSLEEELKKIFALLENTKEYNTDPIHWYEIDKYAKKTENSILGLTKELREYKEIIKEKKEKSIESKTKRAEYEIHHLFKIHKELQYFIEFASGIKGKLSNHPFLLLTGEAGIGKTHLLCDIVKNRITSNLPAMLIFGEFFKENINIWQQIINQLNLLPDIDSKEKFLGKLNEAGKNSQCRSLLIIDALNETIPPSFWKKNLKELAEEIKKFPNIALIISIRSGFEEEILSKEIKKKFIEVRHEGFSFKEWEAVIKFFNEFLLPLPEVPLLLPEFQNPLFLLLFCKAFQRRENKRKQIFRGHEGFTYIFENYVDSVAKKIEDDFGILHAPRKNIWDTVIEKIAEEMINKGTDRISEQRLVEIIKSIHPHIEIGEFIKTLDRNLLLVKIPRYSNDFDKIEGYDYRFPFQKFSDHLIIRYLLKKCKAEKKDPKDFFKENTSIAKLLKRNYGLIEALSIQYPEWFKGKEVFEIAPYLRNSHYICEAFIESLIWRRPNAFHKNTIKKISLFLRKKVLDSVLEKNKDYDDYFIYPECTYKLLDALLSVASVPNHPLNANFFHTHLIKRSTPQRDAWWSTFLHFQYGQRNAVERIIEWSWSDYDKSHIKDKSIFLLSIALVWFLTTPNRAIRDKSTKALVSLLQDRIYLLPELLEKFKDINDLYVLERLFTVAYGCVLRNKDDLKNLGKLSQYVYINIFSDNNPPVHILLRDYARGIIEAALRRCTDLRIDENKINPPYESDWPQYLPSDNETKEYEYNYQSDSFKDYYWSKNTIISSMQPEHNTIGGGSYGDFGRYVFQSALSYWDTGRITIQQLSNLGVKIIFNELGYDVELHGKFDRYLSKNYYDRRTHKFERIGKKYQWIALHKILALVSDHFSLKKEHWNNIRKEYKGPWEPDIRDIDPSLLIKNDKHLKKSINLKSWFSVAKGYDAWKKEIKSIAWLEMKDDLPDPSSIIQIIDNNGQEWLTLEGSIKWEEETPPEFKKYQIPIRELQYLIKSYIIKKKDFNKILKWTKKQSFGEGRIPESNEFYGVFLGEYPNSLAFEDLRDNFNIWTQEEQELDNLPAPVVVTSDIYLSEFSPDCSYDSSIYIKFPCKLLVSEMQLNHKFIDGRWFNKNEKLVALPTNIFEESPFSALLIRKNYLKEFLNERKYTIFWILLGEKQIIGKSVNYNDYKGRLIINGVYYSDLDKIDYLVGRFNCKFEK